MLSFLSLRKEAFYREKTFPLSNSPLQKKQLRQYFDFERKDYGAYCMVLKNMLEKIIYLISLPVIHLEVLI